MERINVKAAVIGGGPSGYAAAIGIARKFGGNSTVMLERQAKTGRKLLATGNGRCNISNENVSPEHYHGDENIIGSVIGGFNADALKGFFTSLGVLLRSDSEGRIYPYSNQAVTILDSLRNECARLGVSERCSFLTRSIRRENGRFVITSDDTEVFCEKLIIAAGSKAFPQSGADDSGYGLLKMLGIGYKEIFPALCPISTAEKYRSLKGVRARGKVTLLADGKALKETQGEIQFTDSGISGICVFELSRSVSEFFLKGSIDGVTCKKLQIAADLVSSLSFPELCSYLLTCKELFGAAPAGELLSGALNIQLSRVIAKTCALSEKTCSSLTARDIKQLASAAKRLTFTPSGMGSFSSAQVCAGGVGSDEVFPDSLMSKNHKGLYICGELLDVDGDCGGFNLHFAIASGLKAAASASGGGKSLH